MFQNEVFIMERKKISWTRKESHMVSACCATMRAWALTRDLSMIPDMVMCVYNPWAWEMRVDRTVELAGCEPGLLGELQVSERPYLKHGAVFMEGAVQKRWCSSTLGPLHFSGSFSRHCLKRLLHGCLKLSEHLQALSVFWLLQTVWFAFPEYASLFLVPCALQIHSASSL